MRLQLLLIAKAPVPGRVKTRLCPPCTPAGAAAVAAASLADTVDALDRAAYARLYAARRTIVLCGHHPVPAGWYRTGQRGEGLGERLANAYADTALAGTATILVGMDTPQLTPGLLAGLAAGLAHADAALGPAYDGGWWGLGLREPGHAAALRDVPMSTARTGVSTIDALRARGLSVTLAAPLRDVDTAEDARAVARTCRDGRFAAAVERHVPGATFPWAYYKRRLDVPAEPDRRPRG